MISIILSTRALFAALTNTWENYIQKTAFEDQNKMTSRTWYRVLDDEILLEFITLTNHSIDKKILPPEKHGKFLYTAIPLLLVGQLAAHQDYSHNDLGVRMLRFATQTTCQLFEKSGCRFITLHPADIAIPWYETIQNSKYFRGPRER